MIENSQDKILATYILGLVTCVLYRNYTMARNYTIAGKKLIESNPDLKPSPFLRRALEEKAIP